MCTEVDPGKSSRTQSAGGSSYGNERYRASGLNLVVLAIILWNTMYLERAINALRQHGIAFRCAPSSRLTSRLGAHQLDWGLHSAKQRSLCSRSIETLTAGRCADYGQRSGFVRLSVQFFPFGVVRPVRKAGPRVATPPKSSAVWLVRRLRLKKLTSWKLILRPGSQKLNLSILSFVKTKGGPSKIWLPLITFSLPSLPASTSVSPGFNFPSTTARIA